MRSSNARTSLREGVWASVAKGCIQKVPHTRKSAVRLGWQYQRTIIAPLRKKENLTGCFGFPGRRRQRAGITGWRAEWAAGALPASERAGAERTRARAPESNGATRRR